MSRLIKGAAILLIVSWLIILFFIQKPADLTPGLKTFGVTFSKQAAESFGLDWQEAFRAILDDLGAKNLRLSVYWTETEPSEGQYDFSILDWQLKEAERRGVKIIVAVGQRLPRWPECHIPDWAKNLPTEERRERLLKLIDVVVNRYKSLSAIKYWQVENEPFLIGFGECLPFDKKFLDKEIAFVRSLDSRLIIVSDSGELSLWLQAARRADIFGTTMYRSVWSNKIPGGYLRYPLPPSFFYLKANLIKYFASTKNIIVTELQAEPWGPKQIKEMAPMERDTSLSLEKFKANIEYARQVGFREAYLWGAEWWLWEKMSGRPEFWEYAKSLF
ncbi:MAG: beta-galactosidase [Candidatus Harrisonbacteria bacterium]|nr:beta-galactosidase [Candidatus Harrisonbacteria bacterium]